MLCVSMVYKFYAMSEKLCTPSSTRWIPAILSLLIICGLKASGCVEYLAPAISVLLQDTVSLSLNITGDSLEVIM